MKLRVYLTFTPQNVTKPIIWQLGQKFPVVTNIRTAEVKESMGLVGLELEGKVEDVEQAVRWLEAQGVHVEPIEQSVLAG